MKQLRLYCLPNRFGFAFFLVFILMMLVGATYQNNLVFIMAFLLLALGLAGIIQTARNLRGLSITAIEVSPNYAGETATALVRIFNSSATKKFNLVVWAEKFAAKCEVDEIQPNTFKTCALTLKLPSTWGIEKLGRVRLESSFPYGLFRVWIVFRSQEDVYIYPRPEGQSTLPLSMDERGEDFSHLKTFEVGEPKSRIYWPALARGGDLQSKKFQESTTRSVEFIFTEQDRNNNRRIAQLSLWIRQAEAQRVEYALKTSRSAVPFNYGHHHFHRCMKELVRAAL